MSTATLDPSAATATEPSLADSRAIQLLRSTRNWLRAFVISWFVLLAMSVGGFILISQESNAASDRQKYAECVAESRGNPFADCGQPPR